MRRYTILALMLLLLGLALWADPWPDREGVAGPAQAMSLLSPTPTSAMLTTPY